MQETLELWKFLESSELGGRVQSVWPSDGEPVGGFNYHFKGGYLKCTTLGVESGEIYVEINELSEEGGLTKLIRESVEKEAEKRSVPQT